MAVSLQTDGGASKPITDPGGNIQVFQQWTTATREHETERARKRFVLNSPLLHIPKHLSDLFGATENTGRASNQC